MRNWFYRTGKFDGVTFDSYVGKGILREFHGCLRY